MGFEWHTKLVPEPLKVLISPQDQILLLGSCFAESIGTKLLTSKIQVNLNPFGTLFNPIVIAQNLNPKQLFNDHIIEDPIHGLFVSLDAGNLFQHPNRDQLFEWIVETKKNTQNYLAQAQWCCITLGTAWVYKFLKTNKTVANCQKLPSNWFEKKLLSVDEIKHSIYTIQQHYWKINPSLQFLFSVSPVRHLKDGIQENSISKSILRLSAFELCELDDRNHYFPAYEIMIDDLRDYRFYEKDLIHPNEIAIDYIWDTFRLSCTTESFQNFYKTWRVIQQDLNHKPTHPESKQHQNHLQKIKNALTSLPNWVNIKAELDIVQAQIQS